MTPTVKSSASTERLVGRTWYLGKLLTLFKYFNISWEDHPGVFQASSSDCWGRLYNSMFTDDPPPS